MEQDPDNKWAEIPLQFSSFWWVISEVWGQAMSCIRKPLLFLVKVGIFSLKRIHSPQIIIVDVWVNNLFQSRWFDWNSTKHQSLNFFNLPYFNQCSADRPRTNHCFWVFKSTHFSWNVPVYFKTEVSKKKFVNIHLMLCFHFFQKYPFKWWCVFKVDVILPTLYLNDPRPSESFWMLVVCLSEAL